MLIGIPRETRPGETRVAATPDSVKKLRKKGFTILVENGAGAAAGFRDEDYAGDGVQLGDASAALSADLVLKFHKPNESELARLKKGSLLISFIEPFAKDGMLEKLAQAGIDAMGMELIPRTSRAQSMDALSSQAGIAGYRAVIEAASQYGRFFPLMMTSAGSSKPAKLIVLGAGVAGLQAIATARKLGAMVEAYDVRPEVKEQILSLGAKFVELDIGESGSGSGGYAKELSEEAKARQQRVLTERLKKFDIIISTANIPGRKAPVLITEDAVKGMRTGSVIVDMAAANGGNCPLSEPDKTVVRHGVKLVGITNFPGLVPADSSNFYGNNLVNLISLMAEKKGDATGLNVNLQDDIIAGTLAVYKGDIRCRR
jgi:H+-translocating NAD(P) transhydrogenase subunit alpha